MTFSQSCVAWLVGVCVFGFWGLKKKNGYDKVKVFSMLGKLQKGVPIKVCFETRVREFKCEREISSKKERE